MPSRVPPTHLSQVRKLEFLLAEARAAGATTVVTIGGVQSNHCRSTCAAARLAGMDSALILRVAGGAEEVDEDPGLTGNLLLSRMMGASLHLVSRETCVVLRCPTSLDMHCLAACLNVCRQNDGSTVIGCWLRCDGKQGKWTSGCTVVRL